MKKLFTLLFALSALCVPAQELTTLGASNITRTAATLWGNLSAGNGSVVTAYWGRASAGTNATAWQHSFSLGDTEAGLFSTRPANLTPAALYYFNFSATLTGRTAWATARSFTTLAGAPTSTPVIVWTNLPSGTMTNSVTNTVETVPGWLSTTQTLATTTDADEAFFISPTNGASVFLYATNAISANRTITLNLDGAGNGLLPLALSIVAQPTLLQTFTTNMVNTNVLVATDAGSSAVNGSYFFTLDTSNDHQAGYEQAGGTLYAIEIQNGRSWMVLQGTGGMYGTSEGNVNYLGPYLVIEGQYGDSPAPTVTYGTTAIHSGGVNTNFIQLSGLVEQSSINQYSGDTPNDKEWRSGTDNNTLYINLDNSTCVGLGAGVGDVCLVKNGAWWKSYTCDGNPTGTLTAVDAHFINGSNLGGNGVYTNISGTYTRTNDNWFIDGDGYINDGETQIELVSGLNDFKPHATSGTSVYMQSGITVSGLAGLTGDYILQNVGVVCWYADAHGGYMISAGTNAMGSSGGEPSNIGDILHLIGSLWEPVYRVSGNTTGTLTAVDAHWITGSSSGSDGKYVNVSGTYTRADGWYIYDGNIYDTTPTLIEAVSGLTDYYPDQTGGNSVFVPEINWPLIPLITTNTTPASFFATWSLNCVFAGGQPSSLSNSAALFTNQFIGVKHGPWLIAPRLDNLAPESH